MLAKLVGGPFAGKLVNVGDVLPPKINVNSGNVADGDEEYILWDNWPPRYAYNERKHKVCK